MGDNQLQSRFSVTVIFLNESDVKRDQHQDLTLHAHRQLDDDVSLTINDGKQTLHYTLI